MKKLAKFIRKLLQWVPWLVLSSGFWKNIRACLSPQFPYAGYSNEKFETETLSGGNQETRNFLV